MIIESVSPQTRVLGASSVAVPLTGTLAETVLATVTIPAGAMGLNGIIRLSSDWTANNSGTTKILRARLGGLAGTIVLQSGIATTTITWNDENRRIMNRGSASSQYIRPTSSNGAGSTAAFTAATVNTAVAQDLVFTGDLADVGDTLTLEGYLVELILF